MHSGMFPCAIAVMTESARPGWLKSKGFDRRVQNMMQESFGRYNRKRRRARGTS